MAHNQKELTSRSIINRTLKIWFRFLLPRKKIIGLSFVFKIFSNLSSNIAVPILVGVIINHLATNPEPDISFMSSNIAIILMLLLLSIGLEFLWNRSGAHYITRARREMEQYIFASLLNKSYRFHSGSFGGATVSQFNRFVAAFQYFHDTVFRELFSIAINLIASLVVTFYFSPLIGIVMIVWTIVYVTVITNITKRRYHKKRDGSKNYSRMTGYLADVLGNIMTVKIFAREKYETQKFREITQRKMLNAEKASIWAGLTSSLISLFMAVLNLAVLILTVSSVSRGVMQIGTLVLIQAFTLRLSVQLWQLGTIIRDLDRSFAESSEMTEILTQEPDLNDPKIGKKIKIKNGSIVLDNVRFEYPDEYSIPQFFDRLNISISPGEKIGIVGPSGSGKTTILKLILRLSEINEGSIKVDGHDIREMSHSTLRNAISYVPQEPILFHRTLLENIRYANPDATQNEIEQAAEKSRAHVFIERLPKGYETMVGERGFRLSAGQRQRIAIARAILKPSPILIMDEATSAIDSESEELIQAAMDDLMQSRTTIVVAHRFSTIRKMDRIIFMSYGKIIEQGTHDELIARGGSYAKLWAHQSGDIITT